MKVCDLIKELQKMNGDSRVFMGYDGNVVVTEPASVILVGTDWNGDCWWEVKRGDTVILCAK